MPPHEPEYQSTVTLAPTTDAVSVTLPLSQSWLGEAAALVGVPGIGLTVTETVVHAEAPQLVVDQRA